MPTRAALFEHPEIFSKKVRYDYLFELETWIKGIEAFLQVENLPLSVEERGRVAIRNYVDEIAIARDTLTYVGRVTQKLLGEGKEDFASFIRYLERQISPASERRMVADLRRFVDLPENGRRDLASVGELTDRARAAGARRAYAEVKTRG